jgi:hypothetical protein
MSGLVLADCVGDDRLVLLDPHTRLPIALYDPDDVLILWAMIREDPPVGCFPHRVEIHRGPPFDVLKGWGTKAFVAMIKRKQADPRRATSINQFTRLFGGFSNATISVESADGDDEPLRGASLDYIYIDGIQDDP